MHVNRKLMLRQKKKPKKLCVQDHQPSRGSSGWGDVLTRSHCPLLGSFFRGHWSKTACPYFVGVSVWELTVLVANVWERNRDGEPDGSHWLCKKSQRATSQHRRSLGVSHYSLAVSHQLVLRGEWSHQGTVTRQWDSESPRRGSLLQAILTTVCRFVNGNDLLVFVSTFVGLKKKKT